MRRFLLVTLSLIPGSVAILMGRTLTGFVLMVIGFFGWDFAFLHYSGLWLGAPEWIGPAGVAGGAVATLLSVIGTLVATSPSRNRRRQQRVEKVIREASIAYIRNDMIAAAAAVDRGLKVANDDVDLVHLAWQIALADGDERRARQFERRLRRLDVEEKWRWELDGIAEARQTPVAPPTPPSLSPSEPIEAPSASPPSNTEMNA